MNIGKMIKLKIICLSLLIISSFLVGCSGGKNLYRIGIICGAAPFADIVDGFKIKMSQLGYSEGKDIIYYRQDSNSDPDNEEKILKKFIDDNVDLVFVLPGGTAATAKKVLRGTNIPIVFAMAGIEGNDLVESISHPGGNITGVRFPNKELTAKRLEILHEMMPKAKRIYLVYDAAYPNTPFALEAVRDIASVINLILVEDKASTLEEFKLILQKRDNLADPGVDAIFLMPDYLNHSPDGFGAIMRFANNHRLPVGGGMEFTAEMGALFSYVPNNIEQGMLAGILVSKILNGLPAGDIPVITPVAHLWINYKSAQATGVKVPESLLNRAEKIIR